MGRHMWYTGEIELVGYLLGFGITLRPTREVFSHLTGIVIIYKGRGRDKSKNDLGRLQ